MSVWPAVVATLGAAFTFACADPAPAPPLPPNSFAFGVIGDTPYLPIEQRPYHRALADIARTDMAWMLHVGDLWGFVCSDGMYALRKSEMDAIPHPVVYIPGDNEWTDCHTRAQGGYDPLGRLALVRRTFFTNPTQSLGATPMPLETQASEPGYAEFPENHRWRRGGFVFATLHMVGSKNGMKEYDGKPPAADSESVRRMAAGIAWMDEAFDSARATGAKGVVIAFHAEIGLSPQDSHEGYEEFDAQLQREAQTFPGQVVVIHGDSHDERVDDPPLVGDDPSRFTRIETFGSPRVGWLRVVIDSVAGKVVRVEPRQFRRWF